MKQKLIKALLPLSVFAISGFSAAISPQQHNSKGTAVAYPWSFVGGNPTSRKTVDTSAEEIARKADFNSVPHDVASAAWKAGRFQKPKVGVPSNATLAAFGKAVHASEVLYGSVSWHTRSIWVNLGPKTISTATVDAYVFDVASAKVIYRKKGIQGRSDEPVNGYKIAADVLLTPLVTSVSGGPATPREQRAAQIALGKAYHAWVRGS